MSATASIKQVFLNSVKAALEHPEASLTECVDYDEDHNPTTYRIEISVPIQHIDDISFIEKA